MTRTLVARLDSDGDVLLAGPAVRAAAAGSDHLTLLVSPDGEQAARLLPGVDELVVWRCPWSGYQPSPVSAPDVAWLVERLRAGAYDRAVVLTSDHQSPLPLALLLRLAGVPDIVASSHDYPGSLLDVRHPPGGPHEVQRGLSVAAAAGFVLATGDDGRLRLRDELPPPPPQLAALDHYLVVHPCASVPARSPSPEHVGRLVAALVDAGWSVVVTGTAADAVAAEVVLGGQDRRGGQDIRGTQDIRRSTPTGPDRGDVVDLVGRTTLAELATVLAGAQCLVAGNTGPAHLAAAVGTPVVSLFAPVVQPAAWRPWGVPHRLLGDQGALCAGSRARTCPVPGHPCLDGVDPSDVVAAVAGLAVGVPA